MSVDELEIVEWLRDRYPSRGRLSLGVGDDMAMLDSPGDSLLLSSDMLLDGVHFDAAVDSLELIGRKAIACSLSDCAAMAVNPVAVTLSVAWPAATTMQQVQSLFKGATEIAEAYNLTIAGGDTTRWKHPLVIDVAIYATPFESIQPVTRSGARPGDGLYVTGPLGGSRLGRHLTFTPQVLEARQLAEALGDRLHAMMDISDGLSLDLWRMCQSSGVNAKLDEPSLDPVISDDARQLALTDDRSALDHALSDGEDFELLFTASGDVTDCEVPIFRIGEVVARGRNAETVITLVNPDGAEQPLKPRGYVH